MKNTFSFTPTLVRNNTVTSQEQNTKKMEELKMELSNEMVNGNTLVGEQTNTDKEVIETMQQLEDSIKAEQTSVAHLAIKKINGEDLVNMIVQSNYHAEVGENETHYLVHAPYIRVVRSDVENLLGKLSNTRWRMIFAHRQGELKTFNDYEFAIGNPVQTSDEPTSKEETTQVNARFPISLKEEVDEFKDMLGLSINSFVITAVTEYIKNLKEQI